MGIFDHHLSRGGCGQTMRAGWLIDGTGGPVQKDVCITLDREYITAVRAGNSNGEPAGQETVDLTAMTILPALIDAHVHLALPGAQDLELRKAWMSATRQQIASGIADHLLQHRRCGVLAVRDGGDRGGYVLRMKKQGCRADGPPVDVKAAGWAWHAPGRYGRAIGRAPQHGRLLAKSLQSRVAGCDHLKVIQSGINSLDHFGRETAPQFSADQLDAAVSLARRFGRPVMVHANGKEPVRLAAKAGCNSIEHGYFMGIENLQRLSDQGIWWVPTVVPMACLESNPNLTADQREVARRTRDHQLEQIARAAQLGVRIALGTDAGSPGVAHGDSVRQEMQWLMSAGLSLESAVRSATLEAAALLGWTGRGAVLPGFRADLIAVRQRPRNLPGGLESIEAICVAGRWYRWTLSS